MAMTDETAKVSIRDDRMIAVNRVSMRQTVIIQALAHLFIAVVYSLLLLHFYATQAVPDRVGMAWHGHRLAAKAAHEGTERGCVQLNTRDKSWCCYVYPGNGDQSMSWSRQGKTHQVLFFF